MRYDELKPGNVFSFSTNEGDNLYLKTYAGCVELFGEYREVGFHADAEVDFGCNGKAITPDELVASLLGDEDCLDDEELKALGLDGIK
jgi:hypothetical protein